MSTRSRRPGVVALLALAALALSAAPASAASGCGRAVIEDWSDGRIDKTYPLRCYDEAIDMLPRDVRDYSNAEADMRRALQAAKRGKPAPPNKGAGAPAQPSAQPQPETPEPPTETVPPEPEEPADTTDTAGTPPTGGDDGDVVVAAPETETGSASSVPIPLLILAGLALLLVAAGAAGYVLRRVQARRLPPAGA